MEFGAGVCSVKQHSVFTCRVSMSRFECPWSRTRISEDMSEAQIALFRNHLRHARTATYMSLENYLNYLGLEPQVRHLQTQQITGEITGEDYRLRLIDLFVEECSSVGFEERTRVRAELRLQRETAEYEEEERERARVQAEKEEAEKAETAAILQGREDQSAELQEKLAEKHWECPICFGEFTDPRQISVTCHRPDNKSFTQHKACAECAKELEKCHICRATVKILPLSRIWNGVPLDMQMGKNPYLVRHENKILY